MVDKLTAQLAGRLSFQYQNPMPGFDRSRVKGLVARLVTVKDPAHSTALEVVAGGRLYQVEMCGCCENFSALNADWPTSIVVREQNMEVTSIRSLQTNKNYIYIWLPKSISILSGELTVPYCLEVTLLDRRLLLTVGDSTRFCDCWGVCSFFPSIPFFGWIFVSVLRVGVFRSNRFP